MSRPTFEQVKEILAYDPETGVLTWRKQKQGRRRNKIAGSVWRVLHAPNIQYISIGMLGEKILAHHVAWVLSTGMWPAKDIDHINGNGLDNRLCNLREVTRAQNLWNSRRHIPGLKGAYFNSGKKNKKWTSSISKNGKIVRLGSFDTPEEAHSAYCQAAKKYFEEFARTK